MARSRQYPPSVDPGAPVEPTLPPGWSRHAFGDLFEVIERPVTLRDAEIYQLVNARRSRGGIVPRERLTGDQIRVRNQFLVEAGDFLISKRQIIHGACGIVPPTLAGAVVSNEYAVLRPRPPLTTEYLRYLPELPYFQRTCFHSSVGVDVEKMVFKLDHWFKFKVPLPVPDEQIKIGKVLSSADAASVKTEAVIDQLEVVKKGLLCELLKRGLPGRHTDFHQTEAGVLPASWRAVQVGQAGEWLSGGTPSKANESYWTGPIPWASPKDMKRLRLVDAADHVSEQAIGNGTRLVPAGTLFVVVRGMILAHSFPVAITERPMAFNQDMKALRPSSDFDPEFLLYWFVSKRDEVLALIADSSHGTKRLPTDGFFAMPLPVPPLDEQREIAAGLRQLDLVLERHRESVQTTSILKAGLLDALLTGRVRVTVPAQEAA